MFWTCIQQVLHWINCMKSSKITGKLETMYMEYSVQFLALWTLQTRNWMHFAYNKHKLCSLAYLTATPNWKLPFTNLVQALMRFCFLFHVAAVSVSLSPAVFIYPVSNRVTTTYTNEFMCVREREGQYVCTFLAHNFNLVENYTNANLIRQCWHEASVTLRFILETSHKWFDELNSFFFVCSVVRFYS